MNTIAICSSSIAGALVGYGVSVSPITICVFVMTLPCTGTPTDIHSLAACLKPIPRTAFLHFLSAPSLAILWKHLDAPDHHLDSSGQQMAAVQAELGVGEPSDLLSCDATQLGALAVLLKPVPRRAFLSAWRKAGVLPPPFD